MTLIVTATARTKGTMARVTMNATFITTSTTYVDVTGLTHTVENNYYYTAGAFTNENGNQTRSLKLLENATDKGEQTSTPAIGYANYVFNDFQNTSGSGQTVKMQGKSGSGASTFSVYMNSFLFKSSSNSYAVICANFTGGNYTIPIKCNVDTVDFFGFGADVLLDNVRGLFSGIYNNGNYLKPHTHHISCMGSKEFYSKEIVETHADSFITATIDNVVTDGFKFNGGSVGWTMEGDVVADKSSFGHIWLIFDWSGTKIEVTP